VEGRGRKRRSLFSHLHDARQEHAEGEGELHRGVDERHGSEVVRSPVVRLGLWILRWRCGGVRNLVNSCNISVWRYDATSIIISYLLYSDIRR